LLWRKNFYVTTLASKAKRVANNAQCEKRHARPFANFQSLLVPCLLMVFPNQFN